MADFYPYLIPSLPMLQFGMKPPFSFETFLEKCRQFIPKKEYHILQNLPLAENYPENDADNPTVRKWIAFDLSLRNELVKIRTTHTHADPSHYIRPCGYTDSSVVHAAMAAGASPSPLDAERVLDETRWKALDDYSSGHHFDMDFLVIYAYKLMILLRWENIRNADPRKQLTEALSHS